MVRSYYVSEFAENLIAAWTKPPTFLLVEDEINHRDLFLYCLREFECSTVTAMDGREAIGYMKNAKFDMIFMNLKLPTISGVDVMRLAKSLQPSVPIVVITGYSNGPDVKEALQLGVLSIMEKPIDSTNFRHLFDTFKIRIHRRELVSPAGLPPAT